MILRDRTDYILILIVFVLFLCGSSYSQYYDRLDYLGSKCKDPVTKRELYIGEFFHRQGQCIRAQCLGDLTIWEDKCNDLQIKGHCIKEYLNEDKPYPICCPTYKCEDHIGSTKEMKVYDHYGNIISRSITNIVLVEDNAIGDSSRDHMQTINIKVH